MTKTVTGRVGVELYASKLRNVAGAFKGTSDPYAVVTVLANNPNEQPRVAGKTEVIKNSLNPRWTKMVEIDYEIGQLTRFNVGIYDEIRKAKHNKPMGSAMFEVGEVLGSRGNLKAKKLRNGGTLFCRITAAPPKPKGTLHLGLRGVGLRNVDGMFGKSDPFVEVSSKVDTPGAGLSWQVVYRSKHVDNNLNPVWPSFSLDLDRLSPGEGETKAEEVPLLISVFDWEKSGKHKSLGQFETTVGALVDAKTPGGSGPHKSVNLSRAFVLRKARQKREYGKIVVTTATVQQRTADQPTKTVAQRPEAVSPSMVALPPVAPPSAVNTTQKPSFVDYLSGGCELELAIAIDYTGSNGDPRKPGTLHYIHHDGQLNDYEKAFTSVGSIVGRYDSNQRFPVYGFGAKFGGIIQHCFQVGPKAELEGLGEALAGYRQMFQSGLTMSGPTVFAEVIDVAAARARSAQQEAERIGKQTYSLLLILTDGAVSDIELTKRALRNASDAPLSIVIVGVGSADFTKMQFLDDFANQDPQQRDIVQFVEFNRYAHDKSALTRETLDEIPDQLVNYYYHDRGIMPLPAVHGSQLSIAASEADDEDIDLSIDYNDDDEIVLGDTQGLPRYDDTQYGTASTFFAVPPVPVPVAASAPPSVAASAPPSYQFPSAVAPPPQSYSAPPQRSSAAAGTTFQPQQAPPQQPPKNAMPAFSQALSSPAPAPPSASKDVFHVQVPPNVYPGQQLEVQNPRTQMHMIVTIPPGVQPGGKFAVAY